MMVMVRVTVKLVTLAVQLEDSGGGGDPGGCKTNGFGCASCKLWWY